MCENQTRSSKRSLGVPCCGHPGESLPFLSFGFGEKDTKKRIRPKGGETRLRGPQVPPPMTSRKLSFQRWPKIYDIPLASKVSAKTHPVCVEPYRPRLAPSLSVTPSDPGDLTSASIRSHVTRIAVAPPAGRHAGTAFVTPRRCLDLFCLGTHAVSGQKGHSQTAVGYRGQAHCGRG